MPSNQQQLNFAIKAINEASATLRQVQNDLNNVDSQTKKTDTSFKQLGASAVAQGVLIAKAVEKVATEAYRMGKEVFTSFVEAGNQIEILSERTGFSAETLSGLRYAAELTDTSIQGLEIGIRKMNNVLYEAASGGKGAQEGLAQMGLSVKDLAGLQPEQLFDRIASALAGVQDETTQSALATQFFGRTGTQLLPLLAEGADGLHRMEAEAGRLGLTFSQQDAKAANEFHDEMERLQGQIKGVEFSIGRELLPVLSPMVDKFREWIDQNGAEFARDVAEAIEDISKKTSSLVNLLDDLAKSRTVQLFFDLPNQSQLMLAAAAFAATKGNFVLAGTFLAVAGAGAAQQFFSGEPGTIYGTPVGGADATTAANLARVNAAQQGPLAVNAGSQIALARARDAAVAAAAGMVVPPAISSSADQTGGFDPNKIKATVDGLTDSTKKLKDAVDDLTAAQIEAKDYFEAVNRVELDNLHARIQAYLDHGKEAADILGRQQMQQLEDAKALAEKLHETFGVSLADALGLAMDSLKKQADGLKAAMDRASQSAYDLTVKLWQQAGGGLSVAAALDLQRVAQQAVGAANAQDIINATFGGVAALQGVTVGTFAEGGWVPGPVGAPMPAIVHGGEYVVPVGQTMGGITVQVYASPGANLWQAGKEIVDAINYYQRNGGTDIG